MPRISYRKLWHLLLDKGMNKTALKNAAGISAASVSKLTKGENITTDILVKVCEALDCGLGDIMELVADEAQPVADNAARQKG